MGRKRLLAGGTTLIANGNFATFSWGPFTAPVRITGLWIDLGSSTQQNGVAGLYYAAGPEAPSGANGPPLPIPGGWTALHDFSLVDGGAALDDELYKVPFGTGSTALVWAMSNLEIDVAAVNFYLKVVCCNRSGAASDPHVFLNIEEEPAGLDASQIDVRPQPGFPPPAPPPTPPASTPPAIPPGPQQPDVGPATANLPPASPQTMPAIKIDPRDPLHSSTEVYKP